MNLWAVGVVVADQTNISVFGRDLSMAFLPLDSVLLF